MPSCIIDNREPEHIIKSLQGKFETNNVMTLDAGDCLIATDNAAMVIIERKTPEDLLGSIGDNRLFNQVTRMREVTQWYYLVITGQLWAGPGGKVCHDNRQTEWSWDSLQGALVTIQELGCSVYYCQNDLSYATAVWRIVHRSRDNVRVGATRQGYVMSPGELVLLALPGLGTEKVNTLLEYRPKIAAALEYLTHLDHNSVPGISYGIKRKVRQVLNLSDNEVLNVMDVRDLAVLESMNFEKELT